MTRIEISHWGLKNEEGFTAKVNGEECGGLTYDKDEKLGGYSISIVQVNPRWRNQGIGSELVRSFVKHVGSGVPINSPILDDDTREELRQKGLLNKVRTSGPLELTDQTLLNSLHIVKFLKHGNILPERISISYDLERDVRDPYYIKFYGRTK